MSIKDALLNMYMSFVCAYGTLSVSSIYIIHICKLFRFAAKWEHTLAARSCAVCSYMVFAQRDEIELGNYRELL